MLSRSENKRVVVTGMGSISCLGVGVTKLWDGVLRGEAPFRRIERFSLDGSNYAFGGMIDEGEVSSESEVSLGAQFAAVSARQALEDLPHTQRGDLAVILSSNFGPSEIQENVLSEETSTDIPVDKLRRGFLTLDVDHVAEEVGAGGERTNISLSCASGNAALAHALELIRSGRASMALAGGYDSIQKITWAGLSCLRVMAVSDDDNPPLVRPFDKNRSGTLFSEGAGAMLLEAESHARERGARPMAELAGAGVNNNAHHMTHADKEGRATAEVMTMALRDAGIRPDEVDCVNAHGTGTELNDSIETRALKRVLGERATAIPVTSIKGVLGHAMGAASVLEGVSCVSTIQRDRVPPVNNYEIPDPECDLNIVTDESHAKPINVVVNNSAGIGGSNAAVVFRQVS